MKTLNYTTLILIAAFLISLCSIFIYSMDKEGMRLCQKAGYSKEQCILIMR